MSPWSQNGGATDGSQAAVSRVVLLGASNLTKGIGTVLATARRCWDGPLEVFAALGHGRSFGRASRVLGRQLPGILECGLWEALATSARCPTATLVTDIGNDILYEEPVAQISEWLEACFDRLTALRGPVVVTQLPLDNLRSLSRARYLLLRSLMVPGCRLSLEAVSERVHAVNEVVRRLAAERQFQLVPQRTEWYGFDAAAHPLGPTARRLGHDSASLDRRAGSGSRPERGAVAHLVSPIAHPGRAAAVGTQAASAATNGPVCRRHHGFDLLNAPCADCRLRAATRFDNRSYAPVRLLNRIARPHGVRHATRRRA